LPKGLPIPQGRNNLIATMNVEDRAAVEARLRPVTLDRHMVLERAGEEIADCFFPSTGIGSMIASAGESRRIEAGLFGCEGMSGTAVVLGAASGVNEIFVQVAGQAHTIASEDLRGLMGESATLRDHLLRYVQVLMTQSMQTALSNGHAKLEERLARWLLMCHDRVSGDMLELTHDFLAVMLGVRRPGVTIGTHLLEGKGLIRAGRGRITILDREGLLAEAKESYGVPEAEYARLIGAPHCLA
jgi:CRP-like cAMP-binding protein